MRHKILLVDNDVHHRDQYKEMLTSIGAEVVTASNAPEALMYASAGDIRLAVVDINLPAEGGQEIARRIIELSPATRVAFISGRPARHHSLLERIGPIIPKGDFSGLLTLLDDCMGGAAA